MKKIKKYISNLVGIQGYRNNYSISARIGKHYCPLCHKLLEVKRKSEVVNSESEESKNYDFTALGSEMGQMIGNIQFIRDIYYCGKCNLELAIKSVREYEREQKKFAKKHKR